MARASENVLIVGAGITGLCTGLALAKSGHQVTIIERDSPPPGGGPDAAFFEWNRRGAAQFRHPHAFLAAMTNLLQQSFPELIDDFFAAGARKVTFQDMLPAELRESYVPDPEDEKMWLLMCRRATMETVFRRYAERQENLSIRSDTNVTGLITDPDTGQIVVRGLKLRERRGTQETLLADIVIDAAGRKSKLRTWLQELGAEIGVEDDDAEIVYYTRHYRLLPGVEEPPRDSRNPSTGDLGYIKYGVFPGDNGHFAVIVCIHNDELALHEAVRSPETFDTICRNIPGLVPWVGEEKAEATTASFGFGNIHSVWHHFVKDNKPVALNYFAVGDAALRTNPLYGRGCSTGIIHAHLLADVLADVQDPVERALRIASITEEELRPIFKASLDEDRKGIRRARAVRLGEAVQTDPSLGKSLRVAFGDALSMATRKNVHVLRGAMRTFNLLEKPGAFLKDWRVLAVTLRYMLRGRRKNAGSRIVKGPSRNEMHDIIAEQASARERKVA